MSTVVIVLIVLFIIFLGGEFTQMGLEWYRTLKLPPGTFSGITISFVWLFLFTLIAICLMRIWRSKPKPFSTIITLFVANGVLNLAWSYLFFAKQLMLVAFVDLVLLLATICGLIWLLISSSRLNAYLLVPYGLWVAYAGYLNIGLLYLNS